MKINNKLVIPFTAAFIASPVAYASVESTMQAVQNHLTGSILPLAAVLGLIFAGLSYVAGSPNARSHLVLAIIGAVVGFGAQSIVDLIRSLVR